jgi:hypothetical protein
VAKTKKRVVFKIRARDPKKLMTGANCVLEIDGKPCTDATAFTFHVEAKGTAKVTVSYVGVADLDGCAAYVLGEMAPKLYPLRGKKS